MACLMRGRAVAVAVSRSGISFRTQRHFTKYSYQWRDKYYCNLMPWRTISFSSCLMVTGVFMPPKASVSHLSTHPSFLSHSVPVETARMMLPDDTNAMGNVHGGTILKLMEQAGHIVAMRHCNSTERSPDNPPLITVLARMNQTDFYQPMYVGEVAHVQAAVTYTSKRSIEVSVDVWAENALTGTKRHTNSARLWYVAVPADITRYVKEFQPQIVPQITWLTSEEQESGRRRYQEQKEARKMEDVMFSDSSETNTQCITSRDPGTSIASATTLVNVVVPSDCTQTGHMMGGALMKIMDTAAGICSAKHCRSPAVTVCMDAINFHTPLVVGDLVTATAKIVFTSKRSLVVEVICEAEGLRTGSKRITNTAYFTFVSPDKSMRSQDVPPLKLAGENEERKFAVMKELYEKKKRQRSKN